MTDDRLLWLARMIGLCGLGLLIFSGIGGVLLASRTAQRMKLFKGKTFTWHRLLSLIGAALFLLHPIPMLLANKTTGMSLINVFVPFTAPKQGLWIALGVIAAYTLIVVTISSLYIKKMQRKTWRVLHYGTYLVLFLGLVHGLFISAEFRAGEGLFSGEKKQEQPAMSEEQKREQASAKPGEQNKDAGEIIDFEEPEKVILLVMAGITILFPIWRIVVARKNRTAKTGTTLSLLLLCLFALPPVHAEDGTDPQSPTQEQAQDRNKPASIQRTEPPASAPVKRLSGNIFLTGNLSTLDRPLPSLNEKLTLDYALPHAQVLDLRIENYTEGSYNQNPPGVLGRNINEHKLEIQGTYTYPLNSVFFLSGSVLHHENFTFRDNYEWGILTLTAKIPLSKQFTLTPNLSAEQRFKGGRVFYDTATTLDYAFRKDWTFETTYHRYENFGELDPEPTQKQEFEIGVLRQLPHNQTVGLSFFRHIQFGAPNDQFSFIKVKYGYSF